ncbi:ribonuclease P protein component [Lysobacter sp. F6437]|uniref:ribonuclease P protein component n=1 Tax=Lysobacter sp. F6437 TaxID=3459296 RepID=UPI00403E02CB
MTTTRFPRTARVRAGSDFDRIFKHGRRVALPVLALHWQVDVPDVAAGKGPRLGLAVSRKVDPHAVGRNRIKRALRETFRRHRAGLVDGDYVVVARPGAARLSGPQVGEAFLKLLQRAGAVLPGAAPTEASPALPTPATTGTMPALAPPAAPSADPSPIAPAPSSDGD